MKKNKPGKLHTRQKQKLSAKLLLITGVSVLFLGSALFIYFQVSKPETSKAQRMIHLSQDALPVDMKVSEMVVAPVDTIHRNAAGNYKIAKPLSMTPSYGN